MARIKEGGRKYISKLHKKLNLSCNDPTVAFDTAGMIRIPNSYNVKIELPNRKSPFKKEVRIVQDLPDAVLNDIIVLPCLAQGALGEGNPTHKARFHLTSYLAARLRWFYPPESVEDNIKSEHVEKIVNIISEQKWVDYNSHITKQQVENIVFGGDSNTGYCAATCATLEYDGLCVGRCRYYDGSIGEANE